MTVRELKAEEWHLAEKFFREHFNSSAPLPSISCIVMAEEDGKVIGMLAAQLVTHIEPLGVVKGYEARGVVPALIKELHRLIPDLNFAFSTCVSWRVARLLQRLGFQQMPWKIFRWQKGD